MASAAREQQGIENRRAILKFMRARQKKGMTTSIVEVAEHCGFASHASADYHLRVLEDEGWVTRIPGQYRSRRVVKTGTYRPAQR